MLLLFLHDGVSRSTFRVLCPLGQGDMESLDPVPLALLKAAKFGMLILFDNTVCHDAHLGCVTLTDFKKLDFLQAVLTKIAKSPMKP